MEAGERFGRLTTTGQSRTVRKEYPDKRAYQQVYEECKCSCGTTKWVRRESLTSGGTKSCGCLRRELSRARMTKDPSTLKRPRKPRQLSLFETE